MALSFGRGLVMLILIGTVSLAYRYIASRKKEPMPQNQINETLTFAEAIASESEQSNSRPLLHPSTKRILHYLNLSRYTVDICMEMITCLDITCQLLDLHRRGVKIRLIIDANMAYAPASGIKLLQKQGVQINFASVDSSFKNFCLVDTSAEDSNVVPFIIFGSPPWSKEALSGDNNEIVFITSKAVFVNLFKEEFEILYVGAR